METRDRLPMHLRIRRRREKLGFTGSELARRAEISPTYVSLIEKGVKIPDEEVAVRIAQVLEDDPEIYRAWALATRYGSIDKTITSTERLQRFRSDPEAWRQLAQGEAISHSSPSPSPSMAAPDEADFRSEVLMSGPLPAMALARASSAPPPASSQREMRFGATRPEPSRSFVEVPLYAEGADPDRTSPAGPPLILDRRLLPEGVEEERLLAYRVSSAETVRVATITAGACVVVQREGGRVTPQDVYAVRLQGRVVLARVLMSRRSLLVLPPEGKSKYDVIELESSGAVAGYVVGRVVLALGQP